MKRLSSTATALGCVVLFLTPFAGVGVFTAVQCARFLVAGEWGQAGFFAIFALAFGGVGLGGITAVLLGRRKLQEAEARRTRHPDAPWLWRSDWATGRIEDGGRSAMWGTWAFTALWNLVSLPGGVLGTRAALQEGKPLALLALLFPLIGIGLLVWAVRATLRYRRYGISRLELTTVPGVVGHTLSGTVRTNAAMRPPDGFRVRLTCVRRVTTGSGDSRSTSESILWQEERRCEGRPSRHARGMGVAIPVAFAIPADAVPCDELNPSNRVIWRLELSAEVAGIDYTARFEVPVFRTEQSALPATQEEAALAAPPDLRAYRQPPDSRIQVTTTRRGTELRFPAGRNPGAAAGITAFFLLWTAIVAGLLVWGAPLLFPIVFGVFDLLLLVVVLELWLRVSRIEVSGETVTVASGYLVPSAGRSFPASDIAEITTRIGMQAGGTPYYDLVLVTRGGKKVTAGHALRDKREAEWLVDTIRRGISSTRR